MSPHGIDLRIKGQQIRGLAIPNATEFHRAGPNDVREKRYIFYTFSIYFGAPGGPPGPTFTNFGPDVQQGPRISACHAATIAVLIRYR